MANKMKNKTETPPTPEGKAKTGRPQAVVDAKLVENLAKCFVPA